MLRLHKKTVCRPSSLPLMYLCWSGSTARFFEWSHSSGNVLPSKRQQQEWLHSLAVLPSKRKTARVAPFTCRLAGNGKFGFASKRQIGKLSILPSKGNKSVGSIEIFAVAVKLGKRTCRMSGFIKYFY